MSSRARRDEKRKEWEVESARLAQERDRRAALTMWERIEESDASADVKEILYLLAEKSGLE